LRLVAAQKIREKQKKLKRSRPAEKLKRFEKERKNARFTPLSILKLQETKSNPRVYWGNKRHTWKVASNCNSSGVEPKTAKAKKYTCSNVKKMAVGTCWDKNIMA
jgi:hypothetical protein